MRQRGFTLLEILVAIAIFAVVSIMALGGYNQLIDHAESLRGGMQRLRSTQLAVQRLTQDFAALEPRAVRDPVASSAQPCLLADLRSGYVAQLTRAGWSNPAGISRSTLQRVGYRLDADKLLRDYWPALDNPLGAQPTSAVLLDKVRTLQLRFLDAKRTWRDQWPESTLGQPASADSAAATESRPIAVEITLELEDVGKIVRLVELPG